MSAGLRRGYYRRPPEDAQQQHQRAHAHHDAEGIEHRGHGRVRVREVGDAPQLALPLVREDEAGELGDADGKVIAPLRLIRQPNYRTVTLSKRYCRI